MQAATGNAPHRARPLGGAARGSAPLELRLRCPRCSAEIAELDCPRCWYRLRELNGIVHALPSERTDHFARFIQDYEQIRAEEGRGSVSDAFYLGLPYRDLSGRNGDQWRMRACTFDYLMTRILTPCVRRGARILDLGAGNGWMSYRFALAGFRPVAVDLLTNDRDGLGAAKHYESYLSQLFPRFQAELARLPFHDEQFDAVLFNASFHYAEDAEATLREALRCVCRGGIVVISDTPWYSSEESGKEMVAERHARFLKQYKTASASIESIEFLTDSRLENLEETLSIRWTIHAPGYGLRWALRPFLAQMRNKREPARFRIYVTQRAAR
ncbi:MAG: class I SAM-dependent methyltransferase [Terracidiphilus sp.]|jgi:SAM-dependent methyltransferase